MAIIDCPSGRALGRGAECRRPGQAARQLLPELAAICFITALIWTCLGILIGQEYADSEREAVQGTSNLARAFEESTRRTISEINLTLLSARATRAMQGEKFDIKDWARTQSQLDNMTAGVHPVGAQGDLFASTLPMPLPPRVINLADRPHFIAQQHSIGDALQISHPVLGRQTGRQTIQFTRKLLTPDGAFDGIIVFSLDSDQLSRFYETLQLGDGFVSLMNRDGTVLARGPVTPDILTFP